MAKKIRWSPRAAFNFEDICNYIAKDSEVYATIFANKINTIIKSIPQFPKSGRIVPEYGEKNRIVYRINGDFIEIVAICHCAKPLGNII
jgi:plasmid stabilization system protein ParE